MAENLSGSGVASVQALPNQTCSGSGVATVSVPLGNVFAGTLTVKALARAPFSVSTGNLASGRYRR